MNNNMFFYRFFRFLLGNIYKFYYNPTIIGKENILKDGHFIIVGNHVHIMDQCNVIVSTKRCIHFLAKKEYFDNKKVAWFFKFSGCISVDRSKKDSNVTSQAIDVLINNHVLGLFPEGTRNTLKDKKIRELYEKYEIVDNYKSFRKKMKSIKLSYVNYLEDLIDREIISKDEFISNIYNINDYVYKLYLDHVISKDDYLENSFLPFKYGAVSLALKTDSLIVPYLIIGDYKFRSKNLVIKILKPIKVSDDLSLSNKRLRDALKNALYEYKKSGK